MPDHCPIVTVFQSVCAANRGEVAVYCLQWECGIFGIVFCLFGVTFCRWGCILNAINLKRAKRMNYVEIRLNKFLKKKIRDAYPHVFQRCCIVLNCMKGI